MISATEVVGEVGTIEPLRRAVSVRSALKLGVVPFAVGYAVIPVHQHDKNGC